MPNPSTLAAADELHPLEFIAIPAGNLHAWWEFIEYGLAKMCQKYQTDWKVEDIYAAILTGRSQLHIVRRTRPIGFLITQINPNLYNSTITEFFVWQLWALPLKIRRPEDGIRQARDATDRFIDQLAKMHRCKRIVMVSPRRGFMKWGYKPYLTTYRKELS